MDAVYDLYHEGMIPRSEEVLLQRLKVARFFEKRIQLEEVKQRQLRLLEEKVTKSLAQEELAHQREIGKVLGEYQDFRRRTQDQTGYLAEL